jgi:hypothetical protein
LGIAGASRLDWIGRFDRLHVVTKVAVRETVPRRGHGISETLNKDSRWSQNTGTSTACPSQFRRSKSLSARDVSFGQFVFNFSRMIFGESRD